MADAFKQSFVNKTNPDPYGQIIVVSQKMINEAFKTMWLLADEDSPLKAFKRKNRNGELDIKVGAPEVRLQVTTPDPMLYFRLSMPSGSMWLYTGDTGDDKKTWTIKDWVFTFSVTISRKEVKKEDSDYKNPLKLPESSFSLARLYVDVSSTTKWDPDQSSFGDYDWANESAEIKAQFVNFVNTWVLVMAENKCSVLGYSVQAKKPEVVDEYAPSFPPTSIDYATYPWLDPASSSAQDANNLDQNALCYLMMSSFDKPPSKAGLAYSGAFVKEGGTFCMNRDTFWTKWLVSLVPVVNQRTEVIPRVGHAKDENGDDVSYTDLSVGDNPDHTSADDPFFAFTPDKNNQTKWTWQDGGLSVEFTWNGRHQYCTQKQKSNNSTVLSYSPGGQDVVLNGENNFEYDYLYQSDGAKKCHFNIKIKTNWVFKMALAAVTDGGVQFARVQVADSITSEIDTTDDRKVFGDLPEKLAEYISGLINDAIGNGMSDLEITLLGSLQHEHQLFLPGKGTFLMKDPLFNARGDLMVTLTYDGTDAPDSPQAKALPGSQQRAAKPVLRAWTPAKARLAVPLNLGA